LSNPYAFPEPFADEFLLHGHGEEFDDETSAGGGE
jgi:hypothetical protein